MRFTTLVLLTVLTVPPLAATARASDSSLSTTDQYLYALQDDATYVEGCFDPCMCPIMSEARLEGSFILRCTGTDGQFVNYELSQVSWLVMWQDAVFHRVEGTGLFRLDEEGKQQQLLLQLSIDGNPPISFDGGVVPSLVPFPDLSATVSMNGMYCYDRVFHVTAAQNGKIGVGDESAWGALKARFR